MDLRLSYGLVLTFGVHGLASRSRRLVLLFDEFLDDIWRLEKFVTKRNDERITRFHAVRAFVHGNDVTRGADHGLPEVS